MRQAGIRSRDPREHERHRAYARCFLIEGGVSMMLQLISAASSVIDLIYPPALYCICCGKIIDQTRPYRLCNDCMNEIKWVGERTCGCCGKRLSDADPGAVCTRLMSWPADMISCFRCLFITAAGACAATTRQPSLRKLLRAEQV